MSVEGQTAAQTRLAFTPLHRWLGLQASPMTFDLINQAVDEKLEERADLDFKATPPHGKSLAQSDLVKDMAAMANSGGGMLLFGVTDSGSHADALESIDEEFLSDLYLRDIRRVAISRISPPILDFDLYPVRDEERRALALVVPPSSVAPHLIYVNDSFRAPYRSGPDTHWMDERMLEAAYRRRFEVRSSSAARVREIIERSIEGRDISERAWMVAVAHPSNLMGSASRREGTEAAEMFNRALNLSQAWVTLQTHPLEALDLWNPRPGLRSWRAPFSSQSESRRWLEAEAEVHDDGTVVLTAAMGGARSGQHTTFDGNEIATDRAESFLADFFGLIRASSPLTGVSRFDIEVDVRLAGPRLLTFRLPESGTDWYLSAERSVPLRSFHPVRSVVDVDTGLEVFLDHLREVALDVVNQGGAGSLRSIKDPGGK